MANFYSSDLSLVGFFCYFSLDFSFALSDFFRFIRDLAKLSIVFLWIFSMELEYEDSGSIETFEEVDHTTSA